MSKYKVGDKVILTVSGLNDKVYYPYYEFNNNKSNLWQLNVDEYAEPLSTYTEPLEAKIRRQAAEITRLLEENKRLKAENGEQARAEGQNEAWELAKKFVLYGKGCYSDEEVKKIFGFACGPTVLRNYTYKHAAAKVSEWKKAKEQEIKCGDVLESKNGNGEKIAVIDAWMSTDGLHFEGIGSNGAITIDALAKHYTKTGRHMDIEGLLKQIGEEK